MLAGPLTTFALIASAGDEGVATPDPPAGPLLRAITKTAAAAAMKRVAFCDRLGAFLVSLRAIMSASSRRAGCIHYFYGRWPERDCLLPFRDDPGGARPLLAGRARDASAQLNCDFRGQPSRAIRGPLLAA